MLIPRDAKSPVYSGGVEESPSSEINFQIVVDIICDSGQGASSLAITTGRFEMSRNGGEVKHR